MGGTLGLNTTINRVTIRTRLKKSVIKSAENLTVNGTVFVDDEDIDGLTSFLNTIVFTASSNKAAIQRWYPEGGSTTLPFWLFTSNFFLRALLGYQKHYRPCNKIIGAIVNISNNFTVPQNQLPNVANV